LFFKKHIVFVVSQQYRDKLYFLIQASMCLLICYATSAAMPKFSDTFF
jgi:hypothetical protein